MQMPSLDPLCAMAIRRSVIVLSILLSSFKENPQEKIHERLDDHDGEQKKGIFHLI